MTIRDWSKTPANNASAGSIDFAENMAPNKINDSARQLMADVASEMENIPHYYEAGGTANALTITTSWPLTAYADGQQFTVKASLANTSAITLNVDGVGAANVLKLDGNDHASGDIAVGDVFDVVRVGSSWQRKTPLSADAAFLADAQANAAIAATKASEATTDAATAATKASEATASAATASTQATNATNSATTAATQASSATTSATSASTSASTAATQAANATNSATTAATKESEATTNATLANTARVSAQSDATLANAERVAMQAANAGVLNSYFGKELAFTANLAADPDFVTGFVYDYRHDGLQSHQMPDGFPVPAAILGFTNRIELRSLTDLTLPLYRSYDGNTTNSVIASTSEQIEWALMTQGQLWFGSQFGVVRMDFVDNSAFRWRSSNAFTWAGRYNGFLDQANDGLGYALNIPTSQFLVGDVTLDGCNFTLADAPVDHYGRLLPTIVATTDVGISVIRDDGTVVDITSAGPVWRKLAVSKTGKIAAINASENALWVFDIPDADMVLSNGVNASRYDENSSPSVQATGNNIYDLRDIVWSGDTVVFGTRDESHHLVFLDTTNNSVRFVTKDHATPTLFGDVELCLCDGLTDRSFTGTVVTDNGSAVIADVATGADQKKITASGGTITCTVTTGGAIYGWELISGIWVFRANTGWVGVSETGGTLTIADGTTFSMLVYVNGAGPTASQYELIESRDAPKLLENASILLSGTSNQVNDVASWKGFVAAGTDDGADVFDVKTGLWVKRYDTTNTSLTDNQIKTLTANADGALVLSDSTKAQRIDKPEIKLDEKQLFLKLYPFVSRLLNKNDGTLQLSAPDGLANDLGPQKAFRSTGITDNATSEKVTVTDNGLVVSGTVAQASGPIASRPSATLAGPGGEYISTDEGSPRPIYKSDGVVWRQITLT